MKAFSHYVEDYLSMGKIERETKKNANNLRRTVATFMSIVQNRIAEKIDEQNAVQVHLMSTNHRYRGEAGRVVLHDTRLSSVLSMQWQRAHYLINWTRNSHQRT